MQETNVVASTTQAESGDITSASAGPAPSLASRSIAGAADVVEQPAADDSLPLAGSDEIQVEELFDFDLTETEYGETTRFSIDTDGILTITTPFDGTLELKARHVLELYEFLMNTITVWRPACKRS